LPGGLLKVNLPNLLKGKNMECFVAHSRPDAAPVLVPLFVMFVFFLALTAVALKILICCRIFAKAGYCWALGLLMLVPIADIIMAFVLAFSDWPIQKQLRLLQQQPRA
jgi:hypothetical protein